MPQCSGVAVRGWRAAVVGGLVLLAVSSRGAGQEPVERTTPEATAAVVVTSVKPPPTAGDVAPRYGVTRNDWREIGRHVPNVRQAIPVREARRDARRLDRTASVRLIGTTPEFAQRHAVHVGRGRFLDAEDVSDGNNVAVIGPAVAAALFAGDDPIGQSLTVGRDAFLVIGTLDPPPPAADDRGAADPAGERDIYIPLSTMRARLGDLDVTRRAGSFTAAQYELTRIEVLVEDPAQVETTAALIRRLLELLHEDSTFAVEIVR